MAQATDEQMQSFADQRIRRRAEQCRALVNALWDDKASLDSIYDRAANGAPWNDVRTDGPPKLLSGQDHLVYNSVATLLLKCIEGTATAQDSAALAANWAVFQAACVQPVDS